MSPPTIKETCNRGYILEALGESHKIVQNSDDVIVLHCLSGENKLTSIKKKRARTAPKKVYGMLIARSYATWNSWQTFLGGTLYIWLNRNSYPSFFSNLWLASHTSTVFLTMWTDRGQGKISRRDVFSLLILQLWNQCKACKWYII